MKQKKIDDSTVTSSASSMTSQQPPSASGNLTSGTSRVVSTSSNGTSVEVATGPAATASGASINSGTILSLQPPGAGGSRLSVSTTTQQQQQQMEGITLPASSAVNCSGNIIICSSAPAIQQQQSIGGWNCQVSYYSFSHEDTLP